MFRLSRPRLVFSQSQFRDRVRDWNSMSLNFETKSETKILWVSISRPSPRLDLSESQYRDRVQDWNYLSLSLETESETIELVETKSLAILWSLASIEFLWPCLFHVLTLILCPRLLDLREEDKEGDWLADRKNKLNLLASSSTSWYSFNILTKCVTISPLTWLCGRDQLWTPKIVLGRLQFFIFSRRVKTKTKF